MFHECNIFNIKINFIIISYGYNVNNYTLSLLVFY
jgi:hypothetical protein